MKPSSVLLPQVIGSPYASGGIEDHHRPEVVGQALAVVEHREPIAFVPDRNDASKYGPEPLDSVCLSAAGKARCRRSPLHELSGAGQRNLMQLRQVLRRQQL